ncbi:unnamed protein product [Symbiodinium microadriaticum]|nr:unnamed protein product [Symbiodinium microadriaticum]
MLTVISSSPEQEAELMKVQEIARSFEAPETAQLLPALEMLRGLYQDGKERISELNAKEEDSKKAFTEKEAAHEKKLASMKEKLETKKISNEFYESEVKDENRIWTYWSKVRERQHRQYLSALRLQHATMKKVHNMIELYEKALSSKGSTSDLKEDLQKVMATMHGGAPGHLVLMQDELKGIQCCSAELDALHAAVQAALQTPL